MAQSNVLTLDDFRKMDSMFFKDIPRIDHTFKEDAFSIDKVNVHKFIDDNDKKCIPGLPEHITEIGYAFMQKFDSRVYSNIQVGDLAFLNKRKPQQIGNYILYIDEKTGKKTVASAIVEDFLEIGASHSDIAKTIVSSGTTQSKFTFIAAGQYRLVDDEYEMNTVSDTYMLPRENKIKDDEVDYESEEKWALLKNKIELSLKNTVHKFMEETTYRSYVFVDRPFPMPKMPFVSVVRTLNRWRQSNKLFIFENIDDKKLNAMKYALYVFRISDKIDNSSLTSRQTFVNSFILDEKDIPTGALMVDRKMYEGNKRPTMLNKYIKKAPAQTTTKFAVEVFPQKNDHDIAMDIMKNVGGYSLNKRPTELTSVLPNDIFKLSGQNRLVSYANKVFRLTISSPLGSSNAYVYRGTFKEEGTSSNPPNIPSDVVVRVTPMYPWVPLSLYDEVIAKFYNNSIALPQFAFDTLGLYVQVIPYLGETLSSIPFNIRQHKYNSASFRKQYWTKFEKTIKKATLFEPKTRSFYNDPKPDNTTVDRDGNFHLIDPDRNAYTERWYGTSAMVNTLRGQLFGIALMCYWFEKENPQLPNKSDDSKIQWVKNLSSEDDDYVTFFRVLMDMSTNDESVMVAANTFFIGL